MVSVSLSPDARLALGVAAAMVAFAANSVLCRMALAGGAMDPAAFTAIRLAAGAATLAALAGPAQTWRAASAASAAALFVYAAAFSFAYVALDAGTGALVLFGAVQATMFAGALLGGERPAPARWAGAAAALVGLAVLAAPGAAAPPAWAAGLMALAGAAWGVYSLRGRRAGPPLAAVAGAFLLAAPAGAALWALAGSAASGPVTAAGVGLAALSGAVASGLGYALWYAVLPRLEASLAGVAQLTVPLLALGGGAALLGETPGWRFAAAGVLILGGVGAATLAGSRRPAAAQPAGRAR